MSKYLFSIFFAFGIIGSVQSQNVAQQVIATASDTFTSSTAQLSWTIGQVVTSSSTKNSVLLIEGFHQSEVKTFILGATPNENIIKVHPNPTVDYVNLQSSSKTGTGSYQIISIEGDILINQSNVDFSKENEINMVEYANGIYLLTIKADGQPLQQFKIIKK